MAIEGFQPGPAALGGALIGLSAVLLMALNGRIAGVSGIVAGSWTTWLAVKVGSSKKVLTIGLAVIFGSFSLVEPPSDRTPRTMRQ